jgi:two-component system chemotaxis response regulator CheY
MNNSNPNFGEQNRELRILVADDDLFMRDLILGILVHSGYKNIDGAGDGADAWEALHEACYYLVITDYEMPKLTGLELIRKMRSEDMLQPVILVSGTMPAEELERHPGLLVDAMLAKPFTAAEFLAAVDKVLRNTGNIPMAKSGQIPSVGPLVISPIPGHKNSSCRILVVDDDHDLRQLSVDALTSSGYSVEGATDGAAGWEALQTCDYDLVITDNHMPKMTGLEMIEKLHSARIRIPVIMATGILPLDEFARKPWLKPDATLERPFTSEHLLAAVGKILGTGDDDDDDDEGPSETLLPKYL